MKYRVTLKKILSVDHQTDRRIPVARVLHRQWDIEAYSHAHARAKTEAALEQQLPNVRGFEIESIQKLGESEEMLPWTQRGNGGFRK